MAREPQGGARRGSLCPGLSHLAPLALGVLRFPRRGFSRRPRQPQRRSEAPKRIGLRDGVRLRRFGLDDRQDADATLTASAHPSNCHASRGFAPTWSRQNARAASRPGAIPLPKRHFSNHPSKNANLFFSAPPTSRDASKSSAHEQIGCLFLFGRSFISTQKMFETPLFYNAVMRKRKNEGICHPLPNSISAG